MMDATPNRLSISPRLCRLSLLSLPAVVLAGTLLGTSNHGSAQDGPTTRATRSRMAEEIMGKTQPSRDMELAFANLGRINEVLVKEGDKVEAGQMLMQQDIEADLARLRAMESEADVQARVELARTQADLARVELQSAEDAGTAVAALEVERAQLEVKAADTRINEEQRLGTVAEHRAQEQRILVEQRSLASPEGGVVQKVDAAAGEVFGPQTPAIRVVTLDPLHVEVINAPAAQVMKLRVGDSVQVRYAGEDQWQEARVIFINPIGDPTGEPGKLSFKADLPNPNGYPAGLRVEVQLPAAGAQARAERPVNQDGR